MNLFSTGNKVSQIKRESLKAISVFQEVIDSLKTVNEKTASEIVSREDQMATLRYERDELKKVQSENSKVIDKINQILKS